MKTKIIVVETLSNKKKVEAPNTNSRLYFQNFMNISSRLPESKRNTAMIIILLHWILSRKSVVKTYNMRERSFGSIKKCMFEIQIISLWKNVNNSILCFRKVN